MNVNFVDQSNTAAYKRKEESQASHMLDNTFSSMMNKPDNDTPTEHYIAEDTRTDKEIIEDMKHLLKNIKSVIRTGFTEDELKALKELIDKIREKLKNGDIDPKEAEKLIQELEQELLVKKRGVTGGSTNKATQEDMKAAKSDTQSQPMDIMGQLMQRLDKAMQEVEELGKSKLKQNENIPTQEELGLLEMLKKNS